MQRMFQHIEAFADLMDRKGYDGTFLSTYGFPDRLKDNLTKHIFQCFDEKKEIGPLNLSTYTKWTHDKSPHIRCDFYVDFTEAKGFEVMKMDIRYANQYGKIRDKELMFKSNQEIPDRAQANKMILGRKQGMKL